MILAHAVALLKKGHEVVIQTCIADTVFEIPDDIIIERIKSSNKIGTLLNAFEQKKADIIIADIIIIAVLLYLKNKKRVIYFAQDFNESIYNSIFLRFIIRIVYYTALKLLKIPTIAVSTELAELLKEKFKCENIDIVNNGVDSTKFYNEPVASLIDRKKENMAILILSRADYRKGFDVGIACINEFKKKYKIGFEVWIVGDHFSDALSGIPYYNYGYINENDLRKILSSADIFLYPSRNEGFPLMVLEAFACKCPVVTTDAVTYVKHESTALKSKIEDYKNLADNIYRLITDRKLRERLIHNGLSYATENSLEKSSIKFEKMINQFFLKHSCR